MIRLQHLLAALAPLLSMLVIPAAYYLIRRRRAVQRETGQASEEGAG